jgi:hypothetical protein
LINGRLASFLDISPVSSARQTLGEGSIIQAKAGRQSGQRISVDEHGALIFIQGMLVAKKIALIVRTPGSLDSKSHFGPP